MAEKTVATRQEVQPSKTRCATRDNERFLAPPVDIHETEQGIVVVADMPGVAKEDVNICVDKRILRFEGLPKPLLTKEPFHAEFQLLKFHREFELGETIDVEKITADLTNGVLTITLPKMEKAKPRFIKIEQR